MQDRERLVLIGVSAFWFIPIWLVATEIGGSGYLSLVIVPGLPVLILAALAFPQRWSAAIAEFRARRTRARDGVMTRADIERHLRRHLGKGAVSFADGLYHHYVARTLADPDAAPSVESIVLRWLKGRHDLVLLIDALAAGITNKELLNHLSGQTSLDQKAVAVLAALSRREGQAG